MNECKNAKNTSYLIISSYWSFLGAVNMNCTLLNDTKETYAPLVNGPTLPGVGIKIVEPCVYIMQQYSHIILITE